jgi:hypothetical protein
MIEFDPDAVADALAAPQHEALKSQLLGATGLFLLIDPMLGDPVCQERPQDDDELAAARDAAWGRATFALEVPPRTALAAPEMPYLVELQGRGDIWLADSVQWAVQETVAFWHAAATDDAPVTHRVSAWIETAAAGETLAAQLSGWIRLHTQSPNAGTYLRLADRRVWSLALHVLGAPYVQARLGCIQRWHWLDPNAACCFISQPSAGTPALNAAELTHFTAEQWRLMAQGQAAHRRLAALAAERVRPGDSPPAACQPISPEQWNQQLKAPHASTAPSI